MNFPDLPPRLPDAIVLSLILLGGIILAAAMP